VAGRRAPVEPGAARGGREVRALRRAAGTLGISFWEIAKLLERGRLRLPRSADQLFEELASHPELDIYPLTPRISLESTRLGPRFHADPADQIIAATARVHGSRPVKTDERIRRSGVVAFV
jgi:PIN domain nuclease of toxin-antitoxin system